mmetsp:Transcript_13617/g.26164  ORF Transcript_13617/g.26164 Transcript_13617/m.26164 type:complete len:261 (-) Transcript_13617:276-1058(-)|eukprot:CAMPEP_0114253274 /NCGR_PEP_ID=MMETSP0058-20121206/16297_1 /TAXON_ID=36894 /ORGANISM="Pyramimonas parkeae, CCMP726" /LENGTH=260 /DNA_ID=CAMNT_0001367293 /DNA_START=318 /DNA_END=1100 /DNA_ORIENTATION=-
MGAGASSIPVDPKYQVPVVHDDEDGNKRTLFLCTPLNDTVRMKASQVLLEVGKRGFRLLRLTSEQPLFDFPFAQIHSWGNLPNKFSFKFYLDKNKSIVLYTFETRLVDELLKAIHETIESILTDRKQKSMLESDFNVLLQQFMCCPADQRLAHLKTSCAVNYFTSLQAQRLVASMESTFDMVDAATCLHFCLVDQNHFTSVLQPLIDPADRDNVLHRVTAEKQRRNQHRTKATSSINPIAESHTENITQQMESLPISDES